jgi:anthranilate synthase component 1
VRPLTARPAAGAAAPAACPSPVPPDQQLVRRLRRPGRRRHARAVWREVLLDGDTPVSAFAKLAGGRSRSSRERAGGRRAVARYTYLGAEPRAAWRLTDGVVRGLDARRRWHAARTPPTRIGDLRARVAPRSHPADAPALGPFWRAPSLLRLRRGALHRAAPRRRRRAPWPRRRGCGVHDVVVVRRQPPGAGARGRRRAGPGDAPPTPRGCARSTTRRRAAWTPRGRPPRRPAASRARPRPGRPARRGRSSTARERSCRRRAIKEYVRAGDVFRAARAAQSGAARLRRRAATRAAALNPSPYKRTWCCDG